MVVVVVVVLHLRLVVVILRLRLRLRMRLGLSLGLLGFWGSEFLVLVLVFVGSGALGFWGPRARSRSGFASRSRPLVVEIVVMVVGLPLCLGPGLGL